MCHSKAVRRRAGESTDDYTDRVRADFVNHAQRTGAVVFACLVALIMFGQMWTLWVIAFSIFGLAGRARRAFGDRDRSRDVDDDGYRVDTYV